MTFVRRQIEVDFILGEQAFGLNGENKASFKGLRCSATINRAGLYSLSSLELRIWGMPLDAMNRASVTNQVAFPNQRNNVVVVRAGDEGKPLSQVFSGNISHAVINANSAPDVSFDVVAGGALIDTVKPAEPTSYAGSVTAEVALRDVARRMTPPRTVRNNGVTAQLSNPYWPGTLVDQVRTICEHAHCMFEIGDDAISMWPIGSSAGDSGATISADTGLVGYPEFSDNIMRFTTLFDPRLQFGKRVGVKSAIQNASGDRWVIANLVQSLDSEMPGGRWHSICECGIMGQQLPSI